KRRSRIGRHNAYGGKRRVYVEVGEMAPPFVGRRKKIIPQTEVQRQLFFGAPVLLGVGVQRPAAGRVGVVGGGERTGLRKAEQEVGEIESGARQRLAVLVECTGEEPAKAERAARVLISEAVLLQPAVAETEGEVVPLLYDVCDSVVKADGLVPA